MANILRKQITNNEQMVWVEETPDQAAFILFRPLEETDEQIQAVADEVYGKKMEAIQQQPPSEDVDPDVAFQQGVEKLARDIYGQDPELMDTAVQAVADSVVTNIQTTRASRIEPVKDPIEPLKDPGGLEEELEP